MKKRLLSAVLALVLCAYPAMAADFGTLTISSDREVIDDSVLYELAEADEPSTLTLRTPDGETGSLTFDVIPTFLQVIPGSLPRVPILLLATKDKGCARCGT